MKEVEIRTAIGWTPETQCSNPAALSARLINVDLSGDSGIIRTPTRMR